MAATTAILLAAGESRRMGQLKALLQWQGASLLEHQVKTLLAAGADRVVVVVGHRADELTALLEGMDRVSWKLNPDYLQGKTTSTKTGLSALVPGRADTLLVLNVDQPRSEATVSYLLDQHRRSGSLITIPEFQGKGGHPLLLNASLLDELLQIEEETLGVKAVVRRHQSSTSRVPMDGPEVLWDLNTPEQYEEALRAQIK